MIFSVIIPFLNEELYIKRCIKALLDQDFSKDEYEIIFVDNGSTDRSSEIVCNFPEVKLIREGKRSAFIARNRGIQESGGKIVVFTDADCLVSKDWLTQIYRVIGKNRQEIILGRCCFPEDSSLFLRMFEDYENAKTEYILSNYSKRYLFAYTKNMAVTKVLFEEFGSFLPWLIGADTEFIQRCISKQPDLKAVYLKEMKMIHLEINSVIQWLRKINTYGQYNRFIEKLWDYTQLGYRTKLEIYNYCFRKNKYSFYRRIVLLLLLIVGDFYYIAGRVISSIKSFIKTQ